MKISPQYCSSPCKSGQKRAHSLWAYCAKLSSTAKLCKTPISWLGVPSSCYLSINTCYFDNILTGNRPFGPVTSSPPILVSLVSFNLFLPAIHAQNYLVCILFIIIMEISRVHRVICLDL